MSAFADFLVTFGAAASAPPKRRSDEPWRPAGAMAGAWNALLAAGPASTLVRTRDVRPWSVWMLGELTRYDSLSAPADPLGAFALDLRMGREQPTLLDGHFLMLAWNAESREWHVWTDRFGTMHAYHGTAGGRSAIGTFHPAVSQCVGASRLDWAGLNGFFAMGFFPEDRTHFEEVRILRPATHHVFTDRGELRRAERYWMWAHSPESGLRFDEAVERFGATLGAVVGDETAQGRIAVPVSGGLDSRTVAALATGGERDRLWLYSYGYGAGSIETRIARRVASARGMRCECFEIGEYLFDRMDDVLAATEGFNDVTQTRQVAVSAALGEHAESVMAAHWGDVWCDTGGTGVGDTGAGVAAGKFLKEGRRWLLENIVAPRLGGDPERTVREAVGREFERVPEMDDGDFRLKALKTDTWSFRWTVTGVRAFQLGAFPRLPFYDSRMSELFCTLPSEFVTGRRLQVEWLKRFAPDLAGVTWQASGASLTLPAFARPLLLPGRALRKAWRLATGATVIERNWEVQFLSERGRVRLRESLLRPGLHLHEFVAPATIAALLDAFFARPLEEKRGYTVSMLLTFSAWLERYA